MLKAARDEGSKLAGLTNELGIKFSAGGQNPNNLIKDAIDKQNVAASKQREALAAKQELQRVQDLARQGNASPTDAQKAAEKYGEALAEARAAKRDAIAAISSVTKPVSAEAKENLKAASQMEKDTAKLQSAFAKAPDSALKQEAQKALANTKSATETARIQANEARRNTASAASAIKSGDAQRAQEYMKAARESLTTSRESLREAASHAQKADAFARSLGIKPDSDGPGGGNGGPKDSGPTGSGGTPSNSSGPKNSGSGGSGSIGSVSKSTGPAGENGNVTGSSNRNSSSPPTNMSQSGDPKSKTTALNTLSSSANPSTGVASLKSEKSSERSPAPSKVQGDPLSGRQALVSSKPEKVSGPTASHAQKANPTAKAPGNTPDSVEPNGVTSARKVSGPNGPGGTANNSFIPKNSGSRDSGGSNGTGGSSGKPDSNGGMIKSSGGPKLSNLQTGQAAINPAVGSVSKTSTGPNSNGKRSNTEGKFGDSRDFRTGPDISKTSSPDRLNGTKIAAGPYEPTGKRNDESSSRKTESLKSSSAIQTQKEGPTSAPPTKSSGNGNAPTAGSDFQRKNESQIGLTKDASSSKNAIFGSASSTGSKSHGSISGNSRSYAPDNSKTKPGASEPTGNKAISSRDSRTNESSTRDREIKTTTLSTQSSSGNSTMGLISSKSHEKTSADEGTWEKLIKGDQSGITNQFSSVDSGKKNFEASSSGSHNADSHSNARIDYKFNNAKDPLAESSDLRAAAERRFSAKFDGAVNESQYHKDHGQPVDRGFRKVDPRELNFLLEALKLGPLSVFGSRNCS